MRKSDKQEKPNVNLVLTTEFFPAAMESTLKRMPALHFDQVHNGGVAAMLATQASAVIRNMIVW